MLFYKLFYSFKIDRAMNFLSRQVAWEGQVFSPAQKIPVDINYCKFVMINNERVDT